MKNLTTLLILCAVMTHSDLVFSGGAKIIQLSRTLEHSDAKPNKQLLRRAQVIFDKAVFQLTGSSNRSLDCRKIFSGGVSKSNMALLVKKSRGRIEYINSREEPELHQVSVLIAYVIRESGKSRPVVISISIHFENGSCEVLDLQEAYEKEPKPYPHIKNESSQTPPKEITK